MRFTLAFFFLLTSLYSASCMEPAVKPKAVKPERKTLDITRRVSFCEDGIYMKSDSNKADFLFIDFEEGYKLDTDKLQNAFQKVLLSDELALGAECEVAFDVPRTVVYRERNSKDDKIATNTYFCFTALLNLVNVSITTTEPQRGPIIVSLSTSPQKDAFLFSKISVRNLRSDEVKHIEPTATGLSRTRGMYEFPDFVISDSNFGLVAHDCIFEQTRVGIIQVEGKPHPVFGSNFAYKIDSHKYYFTVLKDGEALCLIFRDDFPMFPFLMRNALNEKEWAQRDAHSTLSPAAIPVTDESQQQEPKEKIEQKPQDNVAPNAPPAPSASEPSAVSDVLSSVDLPVDSVQNQADNAGPGQALPQNSWWYQKIQDTAQAASHYVKPSWW